MMDLCDKRILLFAPRFFDYDVEIKRILEMKGAMVDMYDERPSSGFFVKSLIRFNRKLLSSELLGGCFLKLLSINY